ncbi:MAG: TraB/GumN family protein [Planctomycetes bacterium]|nr:TraB/GumN family protein [Planctomycetota bacterium]
MTVIEKGEQTFYILGTAHVSAKSVEEVDELIEKLKPQTVVIELCQARHDSINNEERWQNTNIFKVVKEGKGMLLLANLMLSSFQKRIGDKLGVKPGAEMVSAMTKAKEIDAEVVLGDRDVQITLKRTWGGLSFWEKSKLMSSLLFSSFAEADELDEEELEKIKKQDVLTEMLEELGKSYPAISERLIHERDLYLMHSIYHSQGEKVVAVVGAGHVPGIRKHWGEEVDLAAITELPKGGYWGKFFKWGFPLLVVLLFVWSFYSSDIGLEAIWAWFIVNGSLSALGALVALGHPLTIISAFFAAPITSLNPMIGAGMVTGLVEAIMRKPKVKDCHDLQLDTSSLKGFYRNRITRVLLVVALSNVGSMLGTWLGTAWIIKLLAEG